VFEEQPWLLIPIVVLIVEAWNATKRVALQYWQRRGEDRSSGDRLEP
jgi:hypothetical protein